MAVILGGVKERWRQFVLRNWKLCDWMMLLMCLSLLNNTLICFSHLKYFSPVLVDQIYNKME